MSLDFARGRPTNPARGIPGILRIVGIPLLVLLAAAAPAHRPRLPIPPVPPRSGPPDTAAPVPNRDLQPPSLRGPGGTTIAPDFFPMNYHDESKGFIPGSQMFAKPERNPEFAPGFLLQVPFQ